MTTTPETPDTSLAQQADEASTTGQAARDIQKLQRTIVNALQDVKAQDICVFNTTHLSPLFERVIIASATSSRQTRALAASVRDAVIEAGFAKPRCEGEDNGEWIVVDCGAAIAHIMLPPIRRYYALEDLWGDKPVRLRSTTGTVSTAGTTGKRPRPSRSGDGAETDTAGQPGHSTPSATDA